MDECVRKMDDSYFVDDRPDLGKQVGWVVPARLEDNTSQTSLEEERVKDHQRGLLLVL